MPKGRSKWRQGESRVPTGELGFRRHPRPSWSIPAKWTAVIDRVGPRAAYGRTGTGDSHSNRVRPGKDCSGRDGNFLFRRSGRRVVCEVSGLAVGLERTPRVEDSPAPPLAVSGCDLRAAVLVPMGGPTRSGRRNKEAPERSRGGRRASRRHGPDRRQGDHADPVADANSLESGIGGRADHPSWTDFERPRCSSASASSSSSSPSPPKKPPPSSQGPRGKSGSISIRRSWVTVTPSTVRRTL